MIGRLLPSQPYIYGHKARTEVFTALMIFCVLAHAVETTSWQRVPDEHQIRRISALATVSKTSIYEVVPTKIETALVWHLTKSTFTKLSCEDANVLAGGHFTCEQGKKPILVRAVYTNGETGNFTVHYKDSTVYIHHGSLGSPNALVNLPLIINLPFTPQEVFSWASGAK